MNTRSLNSVRVYEARVAFITSPNHYLKRHNSGTEWKRLPATQNPYYEGNPMSCMISDNSFILQSPDHANVRPSNTGNLMDL